LAKICKVLVVEDNDDVRALFEDVLVQEGYHFFMARNGVEMRQVLAAEPEIDILVVDVALPGQENGLRLADEMASQGHNVVLVTGDHMLVERIDQSGHPYLLKPFRIQSLLDLMERVLREAATACERKARRA
jgi:DNA-binding NtrC family response regulator